MRTTFREFDARGTGFVARADLGALLAALGAHMSPAAVDDVFRYAHTQARPASALRTRSNGSLDADGLSFQELFVCLAVGSVLHLLPLIELPPEEGGVSPDADVATVVPTDDAGAVARAVEGSVLVEGGAGAAAATPSAASHVTEAARPLVKALTLFLEAWSFFDRDGTGSITREGVLAIVDEENERSREHTGEGAHALRRHGSEISGGGGRSTNKLLGGAEAGAARSVSSRGNSRSNSRSNSSGAMAEGAAITLDGSGGGPLHNARSSGGVLSASSRGGGEGAGGGTTPPSRATRTLGSSSRSIDGGSSGGVLQSSADFFARFAESVFRPLKTTSSFATSTLLTRARWEELDWGPTGTLSFRGFIAAMMMWVGVGEGAAEDDE